MPCRLPTLTDDALTGEADDLPQLLAKLLRAAMSGHEELGAARQELEAGLGAAEARQQELGAELEAVRRQAQVECHRGLLSALVCSVCSIPGRQRNAHAGECFQHSFSKVWQHAHMRFRAELGLAEKRGISSQMHSERCRTKLRWAATCWAQSSSLL